MQLTLPRFSKNSHQSGINMVDLMMWLVIAALLLASAIQSIGYYQKASVTYQAKSDVMGVFTWVSAATAIAGGDAPTEDHLISALNSGDLKMTTTGGVSNTAIISTPDSSNEELCVGVRATNLNPPENVFYISSKSPSDVIQTNAFPSSCGDYNETIFQGGSGGGYAATNNLTHNANVTSLTNIVNHAGADPARFKTELMSEGGPTAEIQTYVHNTWTVGLTSDKNYWAGVTNTNAQLRPLTPGKTYDQSVWVRVSKDLQIHADALVVNSSGTTVFDTPNVNRLVRANEWTSLTTSWTVPTDGQYARIRAVLGGFQTVEAGTTFDVTGFSLVERK